MTGPLAGSPNVDDGARDELTVRHIESFLCAVLCFRQRLAMIELGPIECERLLGFLQRLQHHRVEARKRRGGVGFRLPYPGAWT